MSLHVRTVSANVFEASSLQIAFELFDDGNPDTVLKSGSITLGFGPINAVDSDGNPLDPLTRRQQFIYGPLQTLADSLINQANGASADSPDVIASLQGYVYPALS